MTANCGMCADNIYPKVLVVSSSVFNPYAGTGVTLSNLFRDWPPDRLAMIHADETFEPDPHICNSYYKISFRERKLLALVFLVRRLGRFRRLFRSGKKEGDVDNSPKKGGRSLSHSRLLQFSSRTLGDMEPFSKISISDNLKTWIQDFRPEGVYAPVSNITYMRFIRDLVSLTNAPLAIHIMDDWPSFIYDSGFLSPIFRRIMKLELRRVLSLSDLRIGIGPAMCDEYERRYGQVFIPFSNPEDVDCWPISQQKRGKVAGPFEVLYVGTINSKNRECLGMLANSVCNLHAAGNDVAMRILTFQPRVDIYRPVLERLPSVTVAEAPGNLDVFRALLMSADLLVMPLDFTEVAVARMRLSVFTKVPAYMLSGVPILMCGPLDIGVVEQAQREGWACVVSEPREDLIEAAILELMHDDDLRTRLWTTGRKIAEERHSAIIVKERFRSALCSIARSN